ncbi:MAG: biopolymer transporter ExbD [Myxococcota bacterium]
MSKYAVEVEEVQPNLIPIMNLFTALIPFLLMSAAFFHLSVIQVSVPVAGEPGEDTDIAKEDDKITLNLNISDTEFKMSASSDTLDPDVLNRMKQTIPKTIGDNEAEAAMWQSLTDAAAQIKGSYIKSDTVIVIAEDDVPYEQVVFALDAVRETTEMVAGAKQRIKLFPRVVLSSLVK